jgi:uncharacterized repeat protein (TIGR01451 family)
MLVLVFGNANLLAQQNTGAAQPRNSFGQMFDDLGRSLFGGTPVQNSQASRSSRPGNRPAWMNSSAPAGGTNREAQTSTPPQTAAAPRQVQTPQVAAVPRQVQTPQAASPRMAQAPQRTSRPTRPVTPAPQAQAQSESTSSRRTAQPGYQPTAPKSRQPVVAQHSAPVVEPPSRSRSSELAGVQPRTLQDALFQARRPNPPSRSGVTEDADSRVASSARSETSGSSASRSRSAEPVHAVEEIVETESASEPIVAVEPNPLPIAFEPANEKLLSEKFAALSIETTGPQRIAVGTESHFKVTLHNSSDVAARDVAVAIQLPEWAEVIDAEATLGDARLPTLGDPSSALTWKVREVAPRSREELVMQILPRKSQSFDMAIQWTQAPGSSQVHVEVQEPKLIMTLAGPKEVSFGEKAIYKLTFSNPGNADAENVMVKLLPIGAGDGAPDTHSIGTIPAGENKVVEMELVARQAGHLAIKAEATGDGGLHAALDEDVLVRRAALKIAAEGPKFQYARTVVNYTVRVTNPGNAACNNVQVAAQLPAKATYLSNTGGGQTDADDSRIVWTVRSLQPGEEKVFQFKCQLENAGLNRLQVAAAAGELKDVATVATEIEALAELELEVVEPEGAFPVGEEVAYEIHITNRGTKTAEGVDVQAFLSNGIEAVSATGAKGEIAAGKVRFETIAGIGAGKEMVLKIKAKAQTAGNHVFRAEVFCKSLGSKLGEEGTTRFYGEAAASSGETAPRAAESAARASEATLPATGAAASRRNSSPNRYENAPASNRYGDRYGSASSRSASPEPTPADADVEVDPTQPLKPIPASDE